MKIKLLGNFANHKFKGGNVIRSLNRGGMFKIDFMLGKGYLMVSRFYFKSQGI